MDGKPFMLPGIFDKDTTCSKIEALRYYLEKQIGDKFYDVYKYIEVCFFFFLFSFIYLKFNKNQENTDDNLLESIIGPENIKFVPLIF